MNDQALSSSNLNLNSPRDNSPNNILFIDFSPGLIRSTFARKGCICMNEVIVRENWKQVRGALKDVWTEFTEDELDQINGDKDRLLRKLQAKYGYSKRFAEESLDKVLDKMEAKGEPSLF